MGPGRPNATRRCVDSAASTKAKVKANPLAAQVSFLSHLSVSLELEYLKSTFVERVEPAKPQLTVQVQVDSFIQLGPLEQLSQGHSSFTL